MIEVFKIFKGFDDVKVTDFSLCQVLDLEAMNLSCISLRLISISEKIFHRVIDEWNRLPETVLHYNTLPTLKKLDCFLKNRGFV